MFIVQELINGEPQTPVVFYSEDKAREHYTAIVKENGYSPMREDDEVFTNGMTDQAGDMEGFERDGANTLVTLYEVDEALAT